MPKKRKQSKARAKPTTIEVTLPPELAGYVLREVECGRFDSSASVLREGLRQMADQEEFNAAERNCCC